MNNELIKRLNEKTKERRIAAIKELKAMIDRGDILLPQSEGYTNNHVHTTYSFSPYSPSKAVWAAINSGLSTVGIIDHDAINGAEEFIEAGEILGIPVTIGFEIRTDWAGTPLRGRRINNPDQVSNAYICAHGLPHNQIDRADAFLKRIRDSRGKRNRLMAMKLNEIMGQYGITIDYDTDVLPLSCFKYGGEVTERHLLFALSKKLTLEFGKGGPLKDFLNDKLCIRLNESQERYLGDEDNSIYEYDLLNILKSSFVSRIYIDASAEETPGVKETVGFIKELGAIPSYCYLGNVEASPTGDKKAQAFEDAYIDELFETCRDIGFQAIAFMPSRNTAEQLERVMTLCERYAFLQISGEDINQPRQSFICRQLKDSRFIHLNDSAWALVGHEKAATRDSKEGIFTGGAELDNILIQERVQKYRLLGIET